MAQATTLLLLIIEVKILPYQKNKSLIFAIEDLALEQMD